MPTPSRALAARAATATLTLALAACTPAPTPADGPSSTAPSAATTGPTAASSTAAQLIVDIAIADGQVQPNGRKIDTTVGTTVVFNVTSDEEDEIHAHTSGDGYELEVKAGQPATGSVTLTSPGSFEVESHHLGKVIVILNAR